MAEYHRSFLKVIFIVQSVRAIFIADIVNNNLKFECFTKRELYNLMGESEGKALHENFSLLQELHNIT